MLLNRTPQDIANEDLWLWQAFRAEGLTPADRIAAIARYRRSLPDAAPADLKAA